MLSKFQQFKGSIDPDFAFNGPINNPSWGRTVKVVASQPVFVFIFLSALTLSTVTSAAVWPQEINCGDQLKPAIRQKILSGEGLDNTEWNTYLKDIYQCQPACSPRIFADQATSLGPDSYFLLTEKLFSHYSSGQTIVDLGAGSGHLLSNIRASASKNSTIVGVDMSRDELLIAKRDHGSDPRVQLIEAMAQSLPIQSGSVDLIAAHMSIMLMKPIEPAIAETHRILKKGGRLVAVTTSTGEPNKTIKQLNAEIDRFLKSKYPNYSAGPADLRIRHEEGIRELFLPLFSEVEEFIPFTLNMEFTPAEVWEYYNTIVTVNYLPHEDRETLKRTIIDIATENIGANGKALLQLPLALWVVRK